MSWRWPIAVAWTVAIVRKLNEEMSAMLGGQSLTPQPTTPQQMDAQIKADIVAWGAVIRKLDTQLD